MNERDSVSRRRGTGLDLANMPRSEGPRFTLRGTTPTWWFGAPILAAIYVFLSPQFVPAFEPAAEQTPVIRWLVGLVVGACLAIQAVKLTTANWSQLPLPKLRSYL